MTLFGNLERLPSLAFRETLPFRLFSDSSSFAWGGVLSPGAITVSTSDYWDSSVIGADIATKETLALNNALQSFGNTVRNSWVDAFVDSQVLLHSWNRRGSVPTLW